MATERIEALARHLSTRSLKTVVVVDAVRTPICKAKRGAFAETTPDVLLRTVLQATLDRSGVSPDAVQDVCVGNVLQPGAGAVMARLAQLTAGIDYTVPLSTVNRQCSSGLQACMNVAASIATGSIDVGIGAGVESMSTNSMGSTAPDVDWGAVGDTPAAQDCLTPMGITSENVAAKYGVTREVQDRLACESHARAAAAQDRGAFDAEIAPVTLEDGKVVAADEGVRRGTTVEKLAKLKPAFQADGSTTAGNSSQVSDGAAAVLMMSADKARELGAPALGIVKSYAVVGVAPKEMGIGPAAAIPEALKKAGLTVADLDLVELNEAFASQAAYCISKLGLNPDKVNVNGGAIALGHPLGCTGARQIATLLFELRRRGRRYGCVSMCIGTGMGAAAIFEAL